MTHSNRRLRFATYLPLLLLETITRSIDHFDVAQVIRVRLDFGAQILDVAVNGAQALIILLVPCNKPSNSSTKRAYPGLATKAASSSISDGVRSTNESSRHTYFITANPDSTWVTQQARQFVWNLEESDSALHFLIHDRDSKFANVFDNVFKSSGFHVTPTPVRAPDANAYAERWVRTVREECLDHLLIMNQTHLKHVLDDCINYYEHSRAHQELDQLTPVPRQPIPYSGQVRKREVLGGIIDDYYCAPQYFSNPLH